MRTSTTAERLKQLIHERNLKQIDILEACQPYCKKYGVQLKKNDLSQYISGKVTPKQNKLSILGMALNVNEVWLMGYDVPKERDNNPKDKNAKSKYENVQNQEKFLDILDELSPALQEHLLKTAKDLLDTQNKIHQVTKSEQEYIKNVLNSVPNKNYSVSSSTEDKDTININYG